MNYTTENRTMVEEICHVLQDIMEQHPDTSEKLAAIVDRLSEMFDL